MSGPALRRTLTNRHIQFIALGGAIGSGLFYGSTATISLAGPAVLIGYIAGGGLMFLIMRALGEMATAEPVSGSFSDYAYRYLGPFAGFAVGWTYWFSWIVVDMAELAVIGIYVTYWFPNLPPWTVAAAALALVIGLNLVSATSFAEAEFWFALVKVVAIIAMIIFGAVIVFFHSSGHTGVANLWNDGGFAPYGAWGVMLAIPFIMFSFGGTELIGITAGEAADPTTTIPKAVNQVIIRILVFYVGAVLVILMLVPWRSVGAGASPFVTAFTGVGLPAAAGVLNFVVITAALSAFNSGLYSTGRMLHSLAEKGEAPRVFAILSSRGRVPYVGILFSGAVLTLGVVLDYLLPARAFVYLAAMSTMALVITWTMILVAQRRFRKARLLDQTATDLRFPMFGWPATSYLGMAGMATVVVMMAFRADTRIALYLAPGWFAALAIGYHLTRRTSDAGVPSIQSDDQPRTDSLQD